MPEKETNRGPRSAVFAVCRILRSNARGLSRNLSALTVPSSQNDIVRVTGSRIWSSSFVLPAQDASDPRDGCTRARSI